MRLTTCTLLDFYEGKYGPTIRIDVRKTEWLELLKSMVLQMEEGALPELDLAGLGDTEKGEIGGLTLISGDTSALVRIPFQGAEYDEFIWAVDAEARKEILSAVDSLIAWGKEARHYLYEGEGVVIELAYKE